MLKEIWLGIMKIVCWAFDHKYDLNHGEPKCVRCGHPLWEEELLRW